MISIIIPALNEEKYLPRLLQSIKKQEFKGDLEIIVADADSKDKTRDIAQEFGCKVVQGGLPGKARNEGAKIAKGDVLLFIDADIVLPKIFFDKILKEFEDNRFDIATFIIFPNKRRILYIIFFRILNFTTKLVPLAYTGTILIKADIHKKIDGFNEDIKFAEDHDYLWRARFFGKHGIIKGIRIYSSTRRFEKDGIIRTSIKYIFAGIHILIFGPIKTNIFNYKFNHYDNDN